MVWCSFNYFSYNIFPPGFRMLMKKSNSPVITSWQDLAFNMNTKVLLVRDSDEEYELAVS